ncbi:DNA topoisomerase (ATP-hydrolyzing) [Mollicutes bacterium LVI A0078]|nr:DNA topoisomerase (ATP-hydrolyzing) [Mollicutes bacterium LVI A0075]WOO91128.1 DNA topoisomerase (ATP-hydrolyzing) [Mollicutes bacterium LVI A0078]
MKQTDLFDTDAQKEMVSEFLDMTIEDIFAERFSNYSKYIIQDRALPDARDGLKPVQRRILYSMNKEGNTFHKQYRKSAKTVGNVIGNYHPHGDTSVYDAMVRMSQSWKMRNQLVIMHGNNGSIDGDSAAAMRYTEAKLSEYAASIIEDIELNTVDMIPNFDDTEHEPTVLPSRVPNLLINGASGISMGYATDIPPHNPVEVIKAAIKVNDNENTTLSELMRIVKGPDFPTGAIVQGKEGLKQAYSTGRGKIVVKSKYTIEKNQIVVTEIPYEVNKSTLLQRIDIIRRENKVEGISEIIDQSAGDFIEIVIKLKKDAVAPAIMQYLLKNTDLQKNYNFNMIAINNRRPMQMGLVSIINAFVEHRRDVILRRSNFLIEKAQTRLHVVDGLMLAILNLDEVVKIIRGSKDKKDAKSNLEVKFGLTQVQSEAVVSMQLYRLTNTDVTVLSDEKDALDAEISRLDAILNDFDVLIATVSEELHAELEKYKAIKRKTQVEDEIEKLEINKMDLIREEDVIVTISKRGYIKRTTLRSYGATKGHAAYGEEDKLVSAIKTTTKQSLYIYFNDGTYLNMPVYDINDGKWKDIGKHISSIAKINDGTEVINVFVASETTGKRIVSMSSLGYYTNVLFDEYELTKEKVKTVGIKTKKDDFIVSVEALNVTDDLITITDKGEYNIEPVVDLDEHTPKRVGRRIAPLHKNNLAIGSVGSEKYATIITDGASYFRVNVGNLELNGKFNKLYENMKSHPQDAICVLGDSNDKYHINLELEEPIELDLNKLTEQEIGDKIKVISRGLEIIDITKQFEV